MTAETLFWSALLSLAPISELRGGIPFAVASGVPLPAAAAWCAAWNALAGPLAYLFLNTAHRLLYRWAAYASFFDRFVARAREKVRPSVEKYGYWGVALFVGIPLPFTGAWTGVLGAWMLGMGKRRSMLAVLAGVLMACVIVSLVVGFGVGALSFLLKRF
ncbi:MAG TPA: small multi-drug export protein [Spirochaetia bacterium]|nr:small multi-drug export protein [Spirochaetia bacterium]HRZ64063.1 small multi-drug export protein [Spirochaetia bacterium]